MKRIRRPSPGLMARLGVPVGGRVRKLRAVEDQSAPITKERTSKLGRINWIEGARSMRAVKGSLGHSLWRGVEKKMDNVRRGGDRG